MTNEIKLPEVEVYESAKGGTDFSELDGKKAKIAGYEVVDMDSSYDPRTGNELPGGQTVPVKRLKVFTEPVVEITNKEGTEIGIPASELCAMKEVNGKWGISDHPKAKIQKIIAKLKVSALPEIVGKEILVRVEEKDDRQYLRFYF